MVEQYAAAGVDELIIPDYNLGSKPQRIAAMDVFIKDVVGRDRPLGRRLDQNVTGHEFWPLWKRSVLPSSRHVAWRFLTMCGKPVSVIADSRARSAGGRTLAGEPIIEGISPGWISKVP